MCTLAQQKLLDPLLAIATTILCLFSSLKQGNALKVL